MQAWGWRLPFLLAAPLGLIGLYIRLKLEDTPKFREMEATHQVEATPYGSSSPTTAGRSPSPSA